MALTVSIFVPPLARRVPVSLYCYSRQYYGLGFFLLLSYFALDLESRAGDVVQLVKGLLVSAPASSLSEVLCACLPRQEGQAFRVILGYMVRPA